MQTSFSQIFTTPSLFITSAYPELALATAVVASITYIRTRSVWLYLAVVMDLYLRKIIGWAMAPTMPAELI